jgi:hypothetical protein
MSDQQRAADADAPAAPSEPTDDGPDPGPTGDPAATTPATAGPGRLTGPGSRVLRRVTPILRRRGVAATAAVLATVLVAGLLAWNGGRPGGTAGGSHPAGSAVAAGSGGASASGLPVGSVGPAPSYTPLTGTSVAPAALLTARGASGGVVPLDATFRLEAKDATPAATLAARLTVEPSFAFSVAAETGDRAVVLAPASPLQAGTLYRFALRGSAGELLDTWAFQAKQPLRIVGTLPDARSAEVPLDTGIEVTFDQDGVADAATHVTIAPPTPGRFEQHERTLAFVPDRPLAPRTLYTVTISRGVTVAASGEATIVDTRFQFETAATTTTKDPGTFVFPDAVVESATSARPTIGIWRYDESDRAPATTAIAVYRLAGLDAAVDAFRSLRGGDDWTRWVDTGLVDVTGLTRVVSAELPLHTYQNGFWIQLPAALPAGWYIVQQSGGTKPIQTVLQVTDVAAYLAVSDTRTIVWANDLRTGGPIADAAISSDGVDFGRTNASGLANGATPKSLLPVAGTTCDRPCDPVVIVRAADGRAIFLPAGTSHDKLDGGNGMYWWYDSDPQTWSVLHTDRNRYRAGDTANLWGYVRDRDSGDTPATVVVSLTADADADAFAGSQTEPPPVASLTLRPAASGAFAGSLPLTALPEGAYTISVAAAGRTIRTASIVVGPIAKPAYQLSVTTGHRVYVAGDQVKVTVDARFFEGTPVPGVPLRISAFGAGAATTDALGSAVWRTTAATEAGQEGPASLSVGASPARAEEADIDGGSRDIVVFPSSRTIDGVGRIEGGRVVVSGGVHVVAIDRLEAAVSGGASIWDLDPRGKAIAGAAVTVSFVELVPSRRQVGTDYDFIEKKVVPIYEIELVERNAGTVHATTAADGSWTASVSTSTDHGYRIVATVRDADGHVARVTTYASRNVGGPYETNPQASLGLTTPVANQTTLFGIGDPVDGQLTDPDHRQAAGDGTRYLFFTAQRGIRDARIQASRRYVIDFPSWGAPNLNIGGVRFTGTGYVGTVWFEADFRVADRGLRVDLTTDAARYAPGGTVTLGVRTRTAAGDPVAATVVLRAVDEKLFAIGAATEEDPLAELYAGVGSGLAGTYRSHRDPEGHPEGGDTTGGGGDDRDDFRDSLLFETITTGADGRASTSFGLSDDLTSWRVTAAAVTRGLQAGEGSVLVPVGLPFFVDASIAPEYLTADRPTIAVRTFGTAVAAGTPVTLRVTSTTLGFDSGPIAAVANANVDVPLPELRSGRQTLTISATTGSGASVRTDRLVRTFSVTDTRLTRQRTSFVELPTSRPFAGGATGFTTVVVADASGGRFLDLLSGLAAGGGARLDRALAADLAAALIKDRFGSEAAAGPTAEPFVAARYQGLDDGLTLLPYSSSDLELSALVAIVAPDKIDRARLRFYLQSIHDKTDETRERQLFALAGLAGLGEPVLPAIQAAAADPGLTVREQLMLGLGAVHLGDTATGRAILDALVSSVGEGSGTLARLRVGSSAADITAGTALAAALAAGVGSPLAPRFWAYVEANPAADRIEVLPAIAFVTATLDRLPVEPARVAWTVDGTRHLVDVGAGESVRLDLTPAQLATLAIEPLAGSVGVTTRWREPVRPDAFAADPDVTIARSVRPGGTVKASDLVVVDLRVTFGAQAANGCREVTELVPSGLAPVGAESRWIDPDNEEALPDPGAIYPYDQSGSRVSFCVEPTATQRTFALRYVARVVTHGTNAWEPAIAQWATDQGVANLTPATSSTIR